MLVGLRCRRRVEVEFVTRKCLIQIIDRARLNNCQMVIFARLAKLLRTRACTLTWAARTHSARIVVGYFACKICSQSDLYSMQNRRDANYHSYRPAHFGIRFTIAV
jgi:hypothetical protein